MLRVVRVKWIIGLTLVILFFATIENSHSMDIIFKIPSAKISKITKVMGLRTFSGQNIAIKMIRGLKSNIKVKAHEIMKKPQIELKNGEIIYPEEINFFFSKRKAYGKSAAFNKSKFTFRAPEGDD